MKERKCKTRIRRKNMGIKRVLLLLILIFIAIQLIRLIVPATITVSRYVYAKVRTFYFATQEFYFTSDKLSSTGAYFETTNWSGSGLYEVIVGISTKKNSHEGTAVDVEYDIDYSYKVYHANGEEYANPDDYINFSISKTSGTVLASSDKDTFDIVVTTNGQLKDDDYITFNVKATSRGPYIETLKGDFKVGITNFGMSYEITDKPNDPYFQLSVTNTRNYYIPREAFGGYTLDSKIPIEEYLALSDENKAKCFSMETRINFDPDVVLLDTTSGVYLDALASNLTTTEIGADGKNYVNSIQFHVDAEESRIIKFYKKDIAADYTYPAEGNPTPIVVPVDLNPLK